MDTPYDEPSFPLGLTRHADPVKAYVTIIEGCNDFCAFCVVPYTRGHERMRSKAEILADVRAAVDSGRHEVQLLGQIVNHYQAPDDPACDFPALLEAVNNVPGVRRIRFASPHPRHASDRLIAAVRDLPAVCKHMHLPVQSGSTSMLARMRRRHTREQYLDLVARIRAAIPEVQLSTDMIVGFPGETEAEFDDTLSLTEAVGFHSMFSFKYSERPNTLASKKLPDDVPEAVKTRRIRGLQLLQRRIQHELHESSVGQCVEVLVDSRSRRRDWELSGRTTGNTVVNFPGRPEWVGRFVDVTIQRAGPNSVWGEAVPPHARVEGDHGRRPVTPMLPSPGRRGAWQLCGHPRRSLANVRLRCVVETSGDSLPGSRVLVEMTIKGLMVDPITNMPIIILRDKDGQKVLPIWVGVFEANAIALQIENIQTPRPMTHDLLRNVIQDLQAAVEKIVVCDLKENTFYALIHLQTPTGPVAIDARPSDAIALALRTRAPILVEERVIDNAKSVDFANEKQDADRLQQWLESLDPDDMGKYKM